MILLNIFFDGESNFQWASVAAIIAFLGSGLSAFISWRNNKETLKLQEDINDKNFKRNIISSARIEWIQEVRKKSVEFISAFFKLIYYVREFDHDYFREPDHNLRIARIEEDEHLSSLLIDLREKGTLLNLYFGPDKIGANQFVNYIVSHIIEIAYEFGKSYGIDDLLWQEKSVECLKDFLRIYFKAEWKRANGEIEDSEIQEYLKKDEIYNKILEIYEGGIESYKERTEFFYNDLKETSKSKN